MSMSGYIKSYEDGTALGKPWCVKYIAEVSRTLKREHGWRFSIKWNKDAEPECYIFYKNLFVIDLIIALFAVRVAMGSM